MTTPKVKFAILATDVVVFTIDNDQLKVMLVKAKSSPFAGLWALPGGLIKPNEPTEDAAARFLKMFIARDVDTLYLDQLYTFGDPKRDPIGRVVSVAYFALHPPEKRILKTTKDYREVEWFPVKWLPALAYDHREIIKEGYTRLKTKLEYSNIIYSLMPNEFTLSNLQKAYEIILEKKLDKRNFRKKLKALNLIRKTGKKETGEPYRPARLYKFDKRIPKNIEII